MTGAPSSPGDDWYMSEQPTRRGLVAELQRIRRRTLVRPIPVLVLATVVTSAIVYKVATKVTLLESEVVLALTEGSLAGEATGIPVDQLRAFVTSVLLPDNKLTELIEKRDLYRLRKKLGPEFAIEQLRGSLDVQIWKNSFTSFDDADDNARRSARIGLTVADSDPDRGFDLARDLAGIVIETLAIQRQKLADEILKQVAALRKALLERLDQIESEISRKQAASEEALQAGRTELAGIFGLDLTELDRQKRDIEEQLVRIATSRELLAGQIAAAGLDLSLSIVDEHRPERPARSNFVLVMIAVVVGIVALVGSALVLGAFDSRVHDGDDVARLGLPVLGHIPGFIGDNVGSMQTRSVVRPRVPSFVRWRSHR
ncbi:MAG TPA: hypothetical protein VHN14_04865 [Kofleriaceae bacterium]|nr:hypothetical protein [Kofleriaceae bacterium]